MKFAVFHWLGHHSKNTFCLVQTIWLSNQDEFCPKKLEHWNIATETTDCKSKNIKKNSDYRKVLLTALRANFIALPKLEGGLIYQDKRYHFVRQAFVTSLSLCSKKTWAVRPGSTPDDIIVWAKRYPNGHVERIVAVIRRGWVETIGFNTRRFNPKTKKFKEGVSGISRNLNHPFSTLRLVAFIGFEGDWKVPRNIIKMANDKSLGIYLVTFLLFGIVKEIRSANRWIIRIWWGNAEPTTGSIKFLVSLNQNSFKVLKEFPIILIWNKESALFSYLFSFLNFNISKLFMNQWDNKWRTYNRHSFSLITLNTKFYSLTRFFECPMLSPMKIKYNYWN